MLRGLAFTCLLVVLVSAIATSAVRAEIGVVASIKPVHSLVAGVMKGVGVPHLIVKGGGSPHTHSLKPSDADALQRAKVVFWVGDVLERFLQGPVETLAGKAKVVTLAEADGLVQLPFREGGPWAEHHDHHGHDDHHGKKGTGREHDHAHETSSKAEHAHGANREEFDLHLWLDPENAKAFVAEIVGALAKADPAHKSIYEANGKDLVNRLDALTAALRAQLSNVKTKPFIVFHDAYQYLEKRFGLNAVGSITVSPDVQPGAQRLREIRDKIRTLGAVCVFAEPQFEPRLVRTVTQGTEARSGELDPLGSAIADGPDLYFELMSRNAGALVDCLSTSS